VDVDGAIVAKAKGSGQLRVAIYALPGSISAGRGAGDAGAGTDGDGPVSYYLIVRGPLGSGKSTVSERLARSLRAQYVSIDRILEESNLEQWESGFISESSFLRANEIAARTARPQLDQGRPVIFDGNFYWRSQIADLVGRLDFPHHIFTLRASLEVCVDRDARRSPPHGRRATEEVYAKSTEFEAGIGIDATPPVDDVVKEILHWLGNS
jgi:predicted kinase